VAVGYPGVPGNPNDKPKPNEKVEGQILASGTDVDLVKLPGGDVVLTDKNGHRRT
jgi:hypothetical protein